MNRSQSSNKENLLNTLNMQSGRRYTNVETLPKNWKPSIKVGYQEPPKIDISVKDIKLKHEPIVAQDPKPCRKKRIETARSNFEIKDSQYNNIESRQRSRRFVKKNTVEVYSKHYKSSLFGKEESTKVQSARRDEKKILPGYRGNNFKGIIEYSEAGKYRSQTITEKCNNVSTKMRSISYADLHEYDFRKRPQRF